MTGIYRGNKSVQIFDSLDTARTAIPASAAQSIEVWEFNQTIEFVRDPEGNDLTMYDGSRWRREVSAAAADAKAVEALTNSENAIIASGQAQIAVAQHQPWIDAEAPYMRPAGIVDSSVWSPKEWTNTNTQNVSLGPTMTDMTTPVVSLTDGPAVRLAPGARVVRKSVTKKRADTDLLVVARVIATGVSGTNTLNIGVYYGTEGNTTGGTEGGPALPLVEGANILARVITRTDIFQGNVVRPYFIRPSGNNAGTTVDVRSFQVFEITNNTVPLLALYPPLDYVADAYTWLQAAVTAAVGIPGSAAAVDLGGRNFRTSQSIEERGAIKIKNGIVRAIGTRADWSGGTPDGKGGSRQKGVFRYMADGVRFDEVTVHGGDYTETTITSVANTVYTESWPLANGFEDAYRTGTVKSKYPTFTRCRVENWAEYGYRYSSGTGGGFNLVLNTANKDQPRTVGSFRNADHNLGVGLLVDASDGKAHDVTIFGGEYCIQQTQGNGTFELIGCHPWLGASAYNRRYYGASGTVIETGIQIRKATQIGAYDATKFTVTRRATDWQVIVTLIANVDQADASPVVIRRDEVIAKMDGWGSFWNGNYIDGGTVRYGRNGLRFFAGYGLPGAMDTPVDGIPGTMLSVFEFQPLAASGPQATAPSQFIEWDGLAMGDREILYPMLGQAANTPPAETWTGETLRNGSGLKLREPSLFENYAVGHAAAMKSKRATVSLAMAPNGMDSASAPAWIVGAGAPEGAVTAPVGSLFTRTDGGASTTLYVKQSGAGNTGWVAK